MFIQEKKSLQEFYQTSNIQLESNNDNTFEDLLPLQIKNNFKVKLLQWEDFCGQIQINQQWYAYTKWDITYKYTYRLKLQRDQEVITKQDQKQWSIFNKIRSVYASIRLLIIDQCLRILKDIIVFFAPKFHIDYLRYTLSKLENIGVNHYYDVKLTVNINLHTDSWVRVPSKELLEHERGHYLIGSLCALEFKKRVISKNFKATQQPFESLESVDCKLEKIFKSTLEEYLDLERQYDQQTQHYYDQRMQCIWNRRLKEQLLFYSNYYSSHA